jgi:hypothetical protein
MGKKLKIVLRFFPVLLIMAALTIALTHQAEASVPGVTTLVSVNNSGNGQDGNNHSGLSSFGNGAMVSRNGKYVAFSSRAANLITGDTNSKQDVFMRDLKNNTTVRISISNTGDQLDATSNVGAISETGRYVIFTTTADGQSVHSTYVRDTKLNTTTSAYPDGVYSEPRGISSEGRFLLFDDVGTGGYWHVYMVDRQLNTTTQLDNANGRYASAGSAPQNAQMSCDGSLIAFESTATTLTGDTPNGHTNIFVLDRRAGSQIVNITKDANNDSVNPTISCNGDYVGFLSKATNITSGVTSAAQGHYYEYDRVDDSYALLDQTANGTPFDGYWMYVGYEIQIDDKGNALFTAKTTNFDYFNIPEQVYLRTKDAQTTERLSKSTTATYSNGNSTRTPFISADGQVAGFLSNATNLNSNATSTYENVFTAQTGL